MDKIGVAIATYNGEKYIKEQLDSIIKQSLKPDVIVVSDGGSDDDTVNLCEKYLSCCGINYKILTSNEQISITQNFERAYSACEAEYVFFADQDDVWKLDKIQLVISYMEKYDAVLGFTNAEIVDDCLKSNGCDLWSSIGYETDDYFTLYSKADVNFTNRLLKRNVVTGMCMCVHNSVKSYLLPFSKSTIHDVWIALLCANLGTIISIDAKSVLYRQHGGNAIGTKSTIFDSIKNANRYRDSINKRADVMVDLQNRLGLGISNEVNNSINQYKKYLMERMKIVNKGILFIEIPKYINMYKTYEVVPFKVLIRDLFLRLGVV